MSPETEVDIAVITLKKEDMKAIKKPYKPITHPRPCMIPKNGESVTAVGWGRSCANKECTIQKVTSHKLQVRSQWCRNHMIFGFSLNKSFLEEKSQSAENPPHRERTPFRPVKCFFGQKNSKRKCFGEIFKKFEKKRSCSSYGLTLKECDFFY